MSTKVAEYLGQRTDIAIPVINPVPPNYNSRCPFMEADCTKISQGYKPVCSVRDSNDHLWIVCRNRLCSTLQDPPLTNYQKDILFKIALAIFGTPLEREQVIVKREQAIPVVDNSRYLADYIMMSYNLNRDLTGPKRVVLEMQGGGETSNTGKITRHVENWEQDPKRNNDLLSSKVPGTGLVITNAWRRQQEQFIIKGNIAQQTGGGIVFCVGHLLFDYLWQRVRNENMPNLRRHNWTLALLGISEDMNAPLQNGSVPLKIDPERVLFTSYINFVQALIKQGDPYPEMFEGKFETLSGQIIEI